MTSSGTGCSGERAGAFVGRQALVADEAAEQAREQAVLVLRALRPGRDQVRQLEPARRRAALGHPAGRRRGPAPTGPRAGPGPRGCRRGTGRRSARCGGRPSPWSARRRRPRRGAVEGLAADEREQGLVDVLDHPERCPLPVAAVATGERAAIRADVPGRATDSGARSLPDRAEAAPRLPHLRALSGRSPRPDARPVLCHSSLISAALEGV